MQAAVIRNQATVQISTLKFRGSEAENLPVSQNESTSQGSSGTVLELSYCLICPFTSKGKNSRCYVRMVLCVEMWNFGSSLFLPPT